MVQITFNQSSNYQPPPQHGDQYYTPTASTSKITLTNSAAASTSSSTPLISKHENTSSSSKRKSNGHSINSVIKGTHYDDSRSGDGDAEEVEDEEEEKVILRENDGINLFKLLNLFQLLDIPINSTSPTDPASLRIALTTPSTPILLDDIRTWCKLALDSPSRTQVDPQLESEISETIFEVLDAIERDYLKDDTRMTKKVKPSKQYYTLHRGLNASDLFTSTSTKLTERDFETLAKLKSTDLMTIVPTPEGLSLAPPEIQSLKLRDINPPLKLIKRSTAAEPVPVSLLYYSPFSSFAPTHDSTTATTTYTRSLALVKSAERLEEFENEEKRYWGGDGGEQREEDERLASEKLRTKEDEVLALMLGGTIETSSVAPSSPLESTPTALSAAEIALLESLHFDSETITSLNTALHYMTTSETIDRAIEENRERLGLLLRAQWERLRTFSRNGGNLKEIAPVGAFVVLDEEDEGEVLGEKELGLAEELLNSLTHLLSSSSTTFTPTSIPKLLLATALSSSRNKKELVRIGGLEPDDAQVVRESEMDA